MPRIWPSSSEQGHSRSYLVTSDKKINPVTIFITANLYFLMLLLFHIFLPLPRIWQPSICYEFVSILFVALFFLNSTYNWNPMVFVFLCLFISLSIIPSRSIHPTNGKVSFFYGWVIFHCIQTQGCKVQHRELGQEYCSYVWCQMGTRLTKVINHFVST